MGNEKEVIDILNDLMRINSDRAEGYRKAAGEIKETSNTDIRSLLYQMSEESEIYVKDLADAIARLGCGPAGDTALSGRIYRVWMDVKSAFTGSSVLSVLEFCEAGDYAALRAYREALDEDIDWPEDIYNIVSSQRLLLKVSHDRIKLYRDEYKIAHTL